MGCANGKKAEGETEAAGAAKGGGAQGQPATATAGATSAGKLLDKYTLGKVLGQGAFGIVYSCKKKGTKEEYAVKMIDKVETPLQEIMMEAKMLQDLVHPTIVKLWDVFQEKAFVCMVMDIYKGGDMIEGMQLHWKSLGMLPIHVVANVSKQMIESIAWLHRNSVVHRDVKGDNYLMDRKDIENPECKIYLSDFGTVKTVKDGERLTSKCGTKTYWSPEFFLMNYGLKVDVWAIGVVMYGLVTGRFPFKGEDDVKHKKIVIPPRSGKPGGDLLKVMLERKEVERISAGAALSHQFFASLAPKEEDKKQFLDFQPEVKESGANAGIDQRRKELMGRLQDAQGGEKPKSLAELKRDSAFVVADRNNERKTKFEWWSAEKVKEKSLLDANAQPAPDEDDESRAGHNKEVLKTMLEGHKVDCGKFGTGSAKTFDEFADEVRRGSARLMLDASQHKCIVRVVDVVLLRITCNTKQGKKYLVLLKEEYPDGRTRNDLNQLPGSKREVHENGMEATSRIIKDRLKFKDCQVKFDFTSSENVEDEDMSPSYPGVRTVYHMDIYEGVITATDPKVLAQIGVSPDGQWSCTDDKRYTRTFAWLTQKECQQRSIRGVVGNREATDISTLVHAPVGIGEEELRQFLVHNKVEVSRFGEGNNKTLKEFSDELVKGEAALVKQADGTVTRFVDVVILKITKGTDVLVEASEERGGQTQTFNRLPAVKRRPDENMFLAARRVLDNNLKISENAVKINPTNVQLLEEKKDSVAYCGLPTLYRKHIVSATVVEDDHSVII